MTTVGIPELAPRKANPPSSRWQGSYSPPAPPFRAPELPKANAIYAEACRLVDMAIAFSALFIAFLWANSASIHGAMQEFLVLRLTPRNFIVVVGFAFLWQEICFLFGLDNPGPFPPLRRQLVRIAGACAVGSALVLVLSLFSSTGSTDLHVALKTLPLAIAMTAISRPVLRLLVGPAGPRLPRRVLIVGSGPRALELYRQTCASPQAECEFVGFVDSQAYSTSDEVASRMLGTLEQLEDLLMHHVVDEVVIALPIKSHYSEIQRALEDCERVGVDAKYLADAFRCSLTSAQYEDSGAFPAMSVKAVREDVRRIVKRVLDLSAALMALLLLAPLLILVALAVKLTSPGPAIFAQQRYGLRKRCFKMYKFRTMVSNAAELQASLEGCNEAHGPVFKIKKDPRVTRLGAFLRKTSLDELPQFFNVLKGDMSLVGPRPLPVRDVHLFRDAWLMRRFSVLPGLTCLWQISGRSSLGFDDWIALDLRYIDQWSLRLDLAILLKTVPAVLRGTGAA